MMKKFFKQSIGILTGILLLCSVFAAVQQWNNSKLEISQKRMLFTDTGLPNGTPVIDINSGGSNISYGPLLDGDGNPYITGGVLDGFIPFSGSDTEVYGTIKFQEGVGLGSNPGVLDFGVAQIQAQDPGLSSPYFEIKNVAGLWDAYSSIMIQDNLLKFSYISGSQGGTFHKLELGEGALEYKGDYSDNFVDGSLVDKRYVDGELSGIETFWEFDGVTLNPTATGDVSLKIGLGSQANISNSASIGQYAYANGTGSYAFGNSAWALGEGSFAIGWQANADGRNAYSVGYNSEANQEDSYVFGVQSVANGFGSMTLGQYAESNNTFSTAIGYSSQANADYSISAGNNTITNSVSSMAIGKYNVGNADSVFEVGFGANGTSRENLFEVKNNGNIYVSKLTGYTCLATDSAGMVYDNTGVFANYIPYTSVDTGFNHTGSDTIIPSEKAVWSLVSGLNNNYVPYRSGDRFFNSNVMFYANTHIGTYSVGDTALLNIRKTGSSLRGISINLNTGGFYNGVGLDIKASKPIVTTTQDIGDSPNTTNISNNSDDSAGYFMTNYVSANGGYSSAISKGGNVLVASNASTSLSGGFYIASGYEAMSFSAGGRRIVMSGANLSFQAYTGGVWVEKGHFTP